jgi:hypothetical protein
MCENFEVQFTAYAWDKTFLVTSILNEDNFSQKWTDSLDGTLKDFPFLVNDIIEVPEWIWMDRIEEVLWIELAKWITNYILTILNLIYKSNPEIRKIFDKNEWNSTYRVIKVSPITIH